MKEVPFIAPATPPGMRVRTGRFKRLRLRAKPGNSELVEERVGEGDVDCHR
jgi:hypothetical protein